MIPTLFSPPSAFHLFELSFVAELAGFAGSGRGGLFIGLLPALFLADVPRGGGRVGLLLTPRRTLPPW